MKAINYLLIYTAAFIESMKSDFATLDGRHKK